MSNVPVRTSFDRYIDYCAQTQSQTHDIVLVQLILVALRDRLEGHIRGTHEDRNVQSQDQNRLSPVFPEPGSQPALPFTRVHRRAQWHGAWGKGAWGKGGGHAAAPRGMRSLATDAGARHWSVVGEVGAHSIVVRTCVQTGFGIRLRPLLASGKR